MKAFKRAYCFQIKRLQLQTHKTLNEIAKDREDCLQFNINKVAAFKAIRRLHSPSFSLYGDPTSLSAWSCFHLPGGNF